MRNGFTQIMAIAGQALPPAVFLSYGYLAANAGYTHGRRASARSGRRCRTSASIWGLFSVVVIVAGATALHAVYTGSGPDAISASATTRRSKASPSPARCSARRFPARSASWRRASSRSASFAAAFTTLISVSLTMTYFCLDMARRNWHFTDDNRLFKIVFAAWIAVPALVAPFWQLPALLKAILAMVGNLLMAPVAVPSSCTSSTVRRIGEFRANAGRNAVLGVTLLFALALVVNGLRGCSDDRARSRADVVARIEATGVVAVVRLTDARVGARRRATR